jgi:hypothetical protein
MSPSTRDSTPLAASTHNKIAAAAITGNSKRSVRISMASGSINALRPSTNSMLTTFVPAMLPTASAPLPSDAATTPTASSGMLAPIDTTVRPTTIGLIPSRDAALALPLTITSAPTTRAPKPAKNHAALANTTSSVDLCHAKRDPNVPYHPRFWRFIERYGTFAPHTRRHSNATRKPPRERGGFFVLTSGRSYR